MKLLFHQLIVIQLVLFMNLCQWTCSHLKISDHRLNFDPTISNQLPTACTIRSGKPIEINHPQAATPTDFSQLFSPTSSNTESMVSESDSIDQFTSDHQFNVKVQTKKQDTKLHTIKQSSDSKWSRAVNIFSSKFISGSASLHVAFCTSWLMIQRDPKNYVSTVPVCPCQVPNQPWQTEFMGFHVDEACDGRKPTEQTCQYHPTARSCYRKKSNVGWSGAQCCYDENGQFLEQGMQGAGTMDLISPDADTLVGKGLGFMGHFITDFLPYWSCCQSFLKSDALCNQYYKYRPAGTCQHFTVANRTDGSIFSRTDA